MPVGRKRKDGNALGLEKRVYWRRGQLKYIHPDGREEPLGTDIAKANERARIYNDPESRYGSLGYWMDAFIADALAGRLFKKRAPRTIRDNIKEAAMLKTVFDRVSPFDLVNDPSLLTTYRDIRSNGLPASPENPDGVQGAPTRCNRELSFLSAVYSWLIENNKCPGLIVNPVSLIARNTEEPKDRYVEDADYRAVYGIAQRSICMAMTLVYITLQRPEDVLSLPRNPVRVKSVAGTARRVLSVTQNKTGATVDIEVTPELDEALAMLTPPAGRGNVARLEPFLIHGTGRKKRNSKAKGKQSSKYTVDGMGAMIRRCCKAADVGSFGLMDVRAKGATDMYLRGVPLERIQLLMGHESVQTTEIYIKRMLQTVSIATPNKALSA